MVFRVSLRPPNVRQADEDSLVLPVAVYIAVPSIGWLPGPARGCLALRAAAAGQCLRGCVRPTSFKSSTRQGVGLPREVRKPRASVS